MFGAMKCCTLNFHRGSHDVQLLRGGSGGYLVEEWKSGSCKKSRRLFSYVFMVSLINECCLFVFGELLMLNGSFQVLNCCWIVSDHRFWWTLGLLRILGMNLRINYCYCAPEIWWTFITSNYSETSRLDWICMRLQESTRLSDSCRAIFVLDIIPW